MAQVKQSLDKFSRASTPKREIKIDLKGTGVTLDYATEVVHFKVDTVAFLGLSDLLKDLPHLTDFERDLLVDEIGELVDKAVLTGFLRSRIVR